MPIFIYKIYFWLCKVTGNSVRYLKRLDRQIAVYSLYHHHFHFYCSAIYTYLGHLQLRSKLTEDALMSYDKAIFQDHENGYAYLGKAVILKTKKQEALVIENYNKGKELLALGKATIYSVAVIYSGTLQYLEKIISWFDYQNIVTHNYSNELTRVKHSHEVAEQIVEAKKNYANNNFFYAQTLYLQVLKQNPQLEYLYYPIANAYMHKGELSSAIDYFNKYLKLYPDDKAAIIDFAYCYLRANKPKVALEYFEQCNGVNIQRGRIFLGMGIACFYLKRYDESEQKFSLALECALAEHDNYHKNFSKNYFERAYYYFLAEDYDLAGMDLTKALDLNSNNVDALLLRAKIYTRRKNYLGAVEDYNKVLICDLHNQEAKASLQKIKQHLGIDTKN